MHGDFFEAWFEEHLLPKVPEDGVIIVDNASFHPQKQLNYMNLLKKINAK